MAILPGPRIGTTTRGHPGWPSRSRTATATTAATWAATVEALRQAGVLDGGVAARAGPLPPARRSLDPHGRVAAEAIAEFELAPVGELIG